MFFYAAPVYGAVCAAGYYLENGECKHCNPNVEPFYCPGDDTRHTCPTTDTDYEKLSGWKLIGGREAQYANRNAATSVGRCYGYFLFIDSHGNKVLKECPFNGENYWCGLLKWYEAGPGFYLSDYSWTSSSDWYLSVRECTNAPANAHYTGPGTPDAPDGSIIDANDCPWECNAGYGKTTAGECLPLCTAGITKIHAGDGVSVPLFDNKRTAPAVAVGYNGRVCYADLVAGRATGAININVGGQIYHTVD